tara:strand:+ start:2467 stop:3222 length:756 start_codon:yes stop_codon:yes gene_type:complete
MEKKPRETGIDKERRAPLQKKVTNKGPLNSKGSKSTGLKNTNDGSPEKHDGKNAPPYTKKPRYKDLKLNTEVYVGDDIGWVCSADEKKRTVIVAFRVLGGKIESRELKLNDIKIKKGAGDKKITDEEIEKELMKYRGVVSAICLKYKITRSGLWKRIRGSKYLSQVYQDSRELFKDEIETEFIKAVRNGDKWAIDRGIEKLLYDRGYVSKQEVNSRMKIDDAQAMKDIARDGQVVMDVVKSIRKTIKQNED